MGVGDPLPPCLSPLDNYKYSRLQGRVKQES
nr:MAG TPA: hypothetical protein [Caudoviricetes sp.]